MIFKYYPHWKYFLMNLAGLIYSGENLVIATIVGTLTNLATRRSFSQLPQFLAVALGCLVVTYLAQVCFNWFTTDAVRHTNQTLRTRAFRGMLAQANGVDDTALGFLTNDFKLLETNRFEAEININIAAFTLILALGYALYLNWLITLLFLAGSCVPMLISNLFQKPLQRASENWSQQNDQYVNQTKNFLAGAGTLALYRKQDAATAKNQAMVNLLESALAKMNLQNLVGDACINVTANLFTFLTPFLVGIYLVIRGQTTLGALFAIVQVSNSFVNPIMSILGERNHLATTKKIVARLQGYLDAAQQPLPEIPATVDDLDFHQVTLQRQQHELVQHVDLDIRPGKKIAVIGRSGSGKSTLLTFLRSGQFGQAQAIHLNHQSVVATHLAGLFAYASQSPVIFADTLRFNLTLGTPVSDERLMKLCRKLDLGGLVDQSGLDYSLGANADQLSGGQLARIELGRALLSQRPILLLDEITAALDKETAMDIHQWLWGSSLTIIEAIHHYEPEDLAHYDQVIDFDQLTAPTSAEK
ncbi:ATP-binding cassette domain-containing protein [Levilactobacillus spicheri]|uniref:ABC transporter n=2 Tax=Levilactobacillus spicheri TaxID=216463 RepID=A0ABQ0WTT2_9LACO|nr:ABC transporter ATP-binding protein [Levilactobacillus spicheri]KRL48796.1 ABC transporter [Levilactobacillus spicheri DSM 15429]GEO67524.1 ABC transporter [Levilactobacillus spicheri]